LVFKILQPFLFVLAIHLKFTHLGILTVFEFVVDLLDSVMSGRNITLVFVFLPSKTLKFVLFFLVLLLESSHLLVYIWCISFNLLPYFIKMVQSLVE